MKDPFLWCPTSQVPSLPYQKVPLLSFSLSRSKVDLQLTYVVLLPPHQQGVTVLKRSFVWISLRWLCTHIGCTRAWLSSACEQTAPFPLQTTARIRLSRWVILLFMGREVLPRAEDSASHTGIPSHACRLTAPCKPSLPRNMPTTTLDQQGPCSSTQHSSPVGVLVNTESQPQSLNAEGNGTQ